MQKRELTLIFLVTFILVAVLIVIGFIPKETPPEAIAFKTPSPTPYAYYYPTASPTPYVWATPTPRFRSELPVNALTATTLNASSECKPFKNKEVQISYVRENDMAFVGIINSFNLTNMKVQVYDYLYDRMITKEINHNMHTTANYYDSNCKEILPGSIKVGDYALIYVAFKDTAAQQAKYIQILKK